MKKSLISLAALALAGCGSFGHTDYEVRANAAGGYDLSAKDGKEYRGDGRSIMFNAQTGALVVNESASKAFTGQALGVKALSILPTMGLGDILDTDR